MLALIETGKRWQYRFKLIVPTVEFVGLSDNLRDRYFPACLLLAPEDLFLQPLELRLRQGNLNTALAAP